MTDRLPDAEIDEIIGRAESDAIAKRFILLAIEVRERRAAERSPIGSDVERELKEAARYLVGFAPCDQDDQDKQAEVAERYIERFGPTFALALLSELAQLRARVGELEERISVADTEIRELQFRADGYGSS